MGLYRGFCAVLEVAEYCLACDFSGNGHYQVAGFIVNRQQAVFVIGSLKHMLHVQGAEVEYEHLVD